LTITDASCHIIRHSFCTQLNKSGEDITVIKELAGHKSISTTEKYIEIYEQEKRKAIGKL